MSAASAGVELAVYSQEDIEFALREPEQFAVAFAAHPIQLLQ
jgi:hypothetical protein